jgi:hypothetical protein
MKLRHLFVPVSPLGNSPIGRKVIRLRVKISDRPVTADCHAAHISNAAGGATPKRPPAE